MRMSWAGAFVLSVLTAAANGVIILTLPRHLVDAFMFGVGTVAFGAIVVLTVLRTRCWEPGVAALTAMFAALTAYFAYLGVANSTDWTLPDHTNLWIRTLVVTSVVMATLLFPWRLDDGGTQ